MYGMTNYGKLFAYEFTNWMIYVSGFKKTTVPNVYILKYASDGSKLVVLSYVDDCVNWYKS